jgi:diaminopimelate decarboxylase
VNDVLILPQWKQISNRRHIEFIKSLLDQGHLWIAAMDIEVYWLAQYFGTHPNLFAPNGPALELTAKPQVKAVQDMGFLVPETISAYSADTDVHAFLRHNSWQVWMKGPYHDAKQILSWDSFEKSREDLQEDWKTSRLFLQKHIHGNEESICFAAYHGKLLAAVQMQKRMITPGGKTWAGRVRPIDGETFEKLTEVIRRLDWSGGGEIEYTRDVDGRKWIIECNPRFPAWIYGSALAGTNLPARVVSAALDLPFRDSFENTEFTRVVQEIAVKSAVGLPHPPDPAMSAWLTDAGKGKGAAPSHAAFMPKLRDCMTQGSQDSEDVDNLGFDSDEEDSDNPASQIDQKVPEAYSNEILRKAQTFSGETPARLHLEEWTYSRFRSVVDHIAKAHKSPAIRIGYSVKTSATDNHLKHAKTCGFLTECISQMEVHRALKVGVPNHEIILNGPGKFWPITQEPVTGLHMICCDSVAEFERVIQIPNIAKAIGFRIQLPSLQSRFGIPVDSYETFQKVVECVRKVGRKAELGFHFHMPSWAIGFKRWREAILSLLTWCRTLEDLTDVPVRHLDLGGGFFPSDLEKIDFRWLQETVRSELPKVEAIYFEPGRSLTQEGEVVFSRVLDIRKSEKGDVDEVVVDACIAELPLISSYSHRVFYQPQSSSGENEFRALRKGKTKVLGRICMENDILNRGLEIPETVDLGDYIIFGDAGAYERSMSYDFGRG